LLRSSEAERPETEWACRWKNVATVRQNYLLLSPAANRPQAQLFDAAARLGDNLDQIRAAIAAEACNRRAAFYREAVWALKTDLAHMGCALPEGTVIAGFLVGDPKLVRAVRECPTKGQPTGADVDAYLEHIQPGLTAEAFHYFQSVRFALPAVGALRRYLKRRKLSPQTVVRLLGGFRVGGLGDPLLRHARALGYPEARFPTKSGALHLCGGLIGSVAAKMWNTIPVATLIGPASLYVALLEEFGALKTAESMVEALPPEARQGLLAVCELDLARKEVLRRGVLPDEDAANDWFWEQQRRPTPAEDALLSGLVRLAAVPLAESVAPAGLTLRAASRFNKTVVPEPIPLRLPCSICARPNAKGLSYPNLVCRACDERAVTSRGRKPETDSINDDGENPVFIDGKVCWRRYRFGGWVTMADPLGCESLEEFNARYLG